MEPFILNVDELLLNFPVSYYAINAADKYQLLVDQRHGF